MEASALGKAMPGEVHEDDVLGSYSVVLFLERREKQCQQLPAPRIPKTDRIPLTTGDHTATIGSKRHRIEISTRVSEAHEDLGLSEFP